MILYRMFTLIIRTLFQLLGIGAGWLVIFQHYWVDEWINTVEVIINFQKSGAEFVLRPESWCSVSDPGKMMSYNLEFTYAVQIGSMKLLPHSNRFIQIGKIHILLPVILNVSVVLKFNCFKSFTSYFIQLSCPLSKHF